MMDSSASKSKSIDTRRRVALKNTAQAVIVPLKDGISSLNGVYEALINADVDPVTGKCSNYDYIRLQIVQAHQHLQSSEQTASSGLNGLDRNLERLIQDEGKLESEKSSTETHLANLRTEQASNEKLLRVSQGALDLARRNLNSTKQTLQNEKRKRHKAKIITGIGVGLFVVPVVGWVAGYALVTGGEVIRGHAALSIRVAEEEVRKSDTEVKKYKSKESEYNLKISWTRHDIGQKAYKLKQTREEIQKVKEQIQSVAEFQGKVRGAVNLLGVLSGRAGVAEHQTRRFILQEPVMKVMEDVLKATEQIAGNTLLYNNDLPRLINQMKENSQRLAAICDSENNSGDGY